MKFKLIAVAAASVLAGCSTSVIRHVDTNVANTDSQAIEVLKELRSTSRNTIPNEAMKNGVHRINQVWMPVTKIAVNDTKHAAVLARNVSVNRNFEDLSDAAAYVTSLTGIPVYVNNEARELANQAVGLDGNLPPPPSMGGSTSAQPGATLSSMAAANSVQRSANISYSGSFSGFLDILTARYGLYWEMGDNKSVRLFKTKSQTFRVAGLPGAANMKTAVGTESSGSSAGGGEGGLGGTSSQSSSTSSTSESSAGITFDDLSVWTALEQSIKTMLTEYGKVVVTPATGTVTVSDTPPSLEKVAEFVKEQNSAMQRQVLLNVRVLSVDLNDSESYGINWDAVYQNVSKGINTTFSTASGLAQGSGSLSFNVFKTNSAWDGTKVMLEALSKQGRVSQVTSASVMTLNNQPAPLQVGKQRSYLASSTTTIGTGDAGNVTTLQPGVVATGFTMSVLPHILDGGKLMLQYSADISSLLGLETVTSGDATIQTPEIDTRNFLQRVMLNNGETLALSGFEQFSADGNRRGIGSPNNLLLGGGVNSNSGKTTIVVLIQPVLGQVN